MTPVAAPLDERRSLFHAVGQAEAADIERFGGFRPDPTDRGMKDKWFTVSRALVVDFGRAFWRFTTSPPRPFVVVQVDVPSPFLVSLFYNSRLDGIGPAYLVEEDQLPELNRVGTISVPQMVYEPPT